MLQKMLVCHERAFTGRGLFAICVLVLSKTPSGTTLCRYCNPPESIAEAKKADMGRPEFISQKGQQMLRSAAETRDHHGNTHTDATFRAALLQVAKDEATANSKNPHAVVLPTKKTIAKLQKAIVPVIRKKPDSQTTRRYEACKDILNFVSLAALRTAIGHIRPDLQFCFDKVTFLLERKVPRALSAKGSAQKSAGRGQGVKVVQDQSKSRSIGAILLTSAAGVLEASICIIKDYKITRSSHHEVSQPRPVLFVFLFFLT